LRGAGTGEAVSDALKIANPTAPQLLSERDYIAIQKQLEGKTVDWMEHVSEEPYRR
jgi:hypothetical protein